MSKTTQKTAPASGQPDSLPNHPAMRERPLPENLEDKIAEPHKPRANLAVSIEKPDGTTEGGWAEKHKDESVLEQHCAFFIRTEPGVIWPQGQAASDRWP